MMVYFLIIVDKSNMARIPRFTYDDFDYDISGWSDVDGRHYMTNNMFGDVELKEEVECNVLDIFGDVELKEEVECNVLDIEADRITLPAGTKLLNLTVDVLTFINPESGKTDTKVASRGYLRVLKGDEVMFIVYLDIIC